MTESQINNMRKVLLDAGMDATWLEVNKLIERERLLAPHYVTIKVALLTQRDVFNTGYFSASGRWCMEAYSCIEALMNETPLPAQDKKTPNIDTEFIAGVIKEAVEEFEASLPQRFEQYLDELGVQLVPKEPNRQWLDALRALLIVGSGQTLEDDALRVMIAVVVGCAPKGKKPV